jgi:hypothetical protein
LLILVMVLKNDVVSRRWRSWFVRVDANDANADDI